jgi:hypothetical protein
MIELTKDEAEVLKNRLEWYVNQEEKDDADYDCICYLSNLIHAYEKCKAEEGK